MMSAIKHYSYAPSVFRVLVIDDQICNDAVCEQKVQNDSKHVQDLIRRYIQSVVENVALNQTLKSKINVEVDFAKDPDEGVALWMKSVYDLTLVDSDFSKGETSRRNDSEKRNFLDLNLEFTGAYLYCFLRDMSAKDKVRKGCEIALWTGLGLGENKDKRANDILSILPSKQESDFDASWFIPKKEQDIGKWKSIVDNSKRGEEINVLSIESCLARMKGTNPVLNPEKATPETIIGRIKSLYRVKSPEEFASLCGLDKQVYVGWLKEEGGGVNLYDEWIDGGISLSPLLRSGEDIDDCVVKKDDSEKTKKRKETDAERLKALSRTLLEIRKDEKGIIVPKQSGQQNKAHIVAAATPLTGCSAVNENYAIELMRRKIAALLDGPFGQVVLKTVYLDSLNQWDNLHWPTLQAQSHHRTRCLRSTAHPRTLWNTGITALESFTPEMMHKFLSEFAKTNPQKCQYVIVSLGSKFPQWDLNKKIKRLNEELKACDTSGEEEPLKTYRNHILNFSKHIGELRVDLEKIWQSLFLRVFEKSEKDDESDKADDNLRGNKTYPIVEINVRHYLRECVAYHLGGHEYLSPAKIDPDRTKDELDFTGCYYFIDLEFKAWLEVLDKTAKDFDKKLLLKLPFRGDLLHFIRLIRDYVKEHEGTAISGITLINAFKSGVVESEHGVNYSPAWYGRLDAWNDAAGRKWTYQMSGELLAASRNELLGEVLNLAGSDLDVHISGGIVDAEGIRYCSPVVVAHPKKCIACTQCKEDKKNKKLVCKNGAIMIEQDKPPVVIDPRKCTDCGECVEKCRLGVIVRLPVQIGTWALMDLNLGESKWLSCANVPPSIGNGRPMVTGCQKCNTCYVQCQSKAFLKGGNGNAARIDIGKCVECKECLRMCPHGAITLGINKEKSTPHDDSGNQGGNKRINPRIAFCLHELCNGCGKCSRTFYCDTFMDRRGLALPPVMDSRNCTGCGLCVQTCPRGAIQLFDPKHVVALIGTGDCLATWHRRLTAYEIPHLVFSQGEIKENYEGWENLSKCKLMSEIWGYRIKKDWFFNRLSPKDYSDDRKWEVAEGVLNKVSEGCILQKWLFLALSDPGQVLKDSPVIYAVDDEKCCYYDKRIGTVSGEMDFGALLEKESPHKGMNEIRVEVERRLNNLREVR